MLIIDDTKISNLNLFTPPKIIILKPILISRQNRSSLLKLNKNTYNNHPPNFCAVINKSRWKWFIHTPRSKYQKCKGGRPSFKKSKPSVKLEKTKKFNVNNKLAVKKIISSLDAKDWIKKYFKAKNLKFKFCCVNKNKNSKVFISMKP